MTRVNAEQLNSPVVRQGRSRVQHRSDCTLRMTGSSPSKAAGMDACSRSLASTKKA